MKKSKISFSLLVAMLAMGMLILTGCPKDEDEEPPPPPPLDEGDYQASGSFTSETEGTVETTSGASITVPLGAVPLTISGETGTMVFSIERDTVLQVTPPSGHSLVSDVYRFGPDGFVLAAPVQVAIPVSETYEAGEVTIYRINPTTGDYEPYGGVYDEETGTVTTQTYELSGWFIMAPNSWEPTDWGCVHFVNNSYVWIGVCITMYDLEYPELDLQYMDEDLGCYMAPANHGPGISDHVHWRVPQGRYQICVQSHLNDPNSPFMYGSYLDTLIIENPFNLSYPTCGDRSIGANWPPIPPDTGLCVCTPIPTPPVGTGDVQVSLTWFNQQPIDLDLWVMDPDSEICAYWNTVTASGGELDRDNLCGETYINGRPENIFWSDAPTGEYTVFVDWYWDCGNDITSQSYNVRVYANAQAQTYSGTILPDEMIEVTRFTVTGPTVIFGPFVGTPRDTKGIPRPKKES